MAGLEEDDDENQQRDALDWLYIASRCVYSYAMQINLSWPRLSNIGPARYS